MVDLHSHILPNIEGDDGSRSLAMSLDMLKMAAYAGTTDIFATPHVNRQGVIVPWPTIIEHVKRLQQAADQSAIPIRIHTGAEVALDYSVLQLITAGNRAYCLSGSAYILVELTEQSQPDQVEALLYELMLRELIPVLAHPERYERIMNHPARITAWMQKGVLTQCNMGSFVGAFGKETQRRAEGLIKNHMVVFLGSDAHRTDWRMPDQTAGLAAFEKMGGSRKVCSQNAQYIIQKKVFYPQVPDCWKEPARGFWARLCGF